MSDELRMAVLIDAENVSGRYLNYIFEELTNYNVKITNKRIYGDWTNPQLSSWKKALLAYSIMPVQQYSYTTGKNSTDSALIIDAMDILYSKSVDAFCIISSDSDFTRLAARLREAGMYVMGMGERKTPKPFIAACENFKYLEVISESIEPEPEHNTQPPEEKKAEFDEIIDIIERIALENSDEDGFVFLGKLGNVLQKKLPDFDVRNYGYRKLTQLIRASSRFTVQPRSQGKDLAPLTYIAPKRRQKSK